MKTPTKVTKLKTPLDGANAERSAILAKVRRMIRSGQEIDPLHALEGWLSERNERYNKRKGGL